MFAAIHDALTPSLRKVFRFFCAGILLSLFSLPAQALDNVSYLDAGGASRTADNVTEVTGSGDITLANGWFLVSGTLTANSVFINGDVSLILEDGASLTASHSVFVDAGDMLTIYAQSAGAGMGELVAQSGNDGHAGLGGADSASCGVITINGGKITATGGAQGGAGIGSGAYRVCERITINGGDIEAYGTNGGAGIGGGSGASGGTITVNGGAILANGSSTTSFQGSAGIGGGQGSTGGNITISGGTVEANAGDGGAGIGGGAGLSGVGGNIVISGGTVEATGGNSADDGGGAGIGSGGGTGTTTSGVSGIITINGTANITARGGDSTNQGGGAAVGSGGTANVGAAVAAGTATSIVIDNSGTRAFASGSGNSGRDGADYGPGGGGNTAGANINPGTSITYYDATTTITPVGGGTITLLPPGKLPDNLLHGQNLAFYITPNPGYELVSVEVGPTAGALANVGAHLNWTIANVTEDITIVATFNQTSTPPPPPPPTASAPIPTLNTVALLLLSLMLAGFAGRKMKKT